MINIQIYSEFNKFYCDRLNKRPWDFSFNPYGFAPEDQSRPELTSDFSAHMPVLTYFSSLCSHVTEFGTRFASSTAALIAGAGQNADSLVWSYDICTTDAIYQLMALDKERKLPCRWRFTQRDTLSDFVIEETDLLFVDTLHTFSQVRDELNRHAHKVNHFLIFHDTFSQADKSLDRPDQEGINRAIREYCEANAWELIIENKFNHGLQVWQRI